MSRRPQSVRWIDGTTCNGMTGLAIDRWGHVGSRTCPICEHRLDDVDGRGTHPNCDPTPAPEPAGVPPLAVAS
jgi:hypothetical protein